MALAASVGLIALLQAEAIVVQGVEPSWETTPTPTPDATAAGPEIQRPKSRTAPTPAPVPIPEPAEVPDPETSGDDAWPPAEPLVTAPAPVEPLPQPPSAVSSGADDASEVSAPSAPPSGPQLPLDTGKGPMIASIATGAVGWSMSLATIGFIAGDGTGNAFTDLEALIYLTGIRWFANGTAMGLAIPAGRMRARYDATQDAIDGTPPRNMDAFIKGGAAALGVGAVGWVVMRIGLFTFFQDCGDIGCGIPYLAGLQTSFALASAGAGVLSYGVAYRKQSRRFGSEVQIRVIPQLSSQYSGLSLAGRF